MPPARGGSTAWPGGCCRRRGRVFLPRASCPAPPDGRDLYPHGHQTPKGVPEGCFSQAGTRRVSHRVPAGLGEHTAGTELKSNGDTMSKNT